MHYFFLFKKTLPFLVVLLLFSCKPRKEMVYYQNIDELANMQNSNSYQIKIQPDDLLTIIVSAEDTEASIPFNLGASANGAATAGQSTSQSYLVDAAGTIDFPILGKLNVAGQTRSEVLHLLEGKIAKYIKNPIVNLRVINFKISVQGEVITPGTFPVNSDRITLIEAISRAGDLTLYGKRDNILVIRETNGVKSFSRVDITKADFINSPFYYLAQNDVIYVEPSKVKINGAAVGPSTGIIFSVTSLIITLVTLIATSTN